MKLLFASFCLTILMTSCTPFIVNQSSLTEQGPGPLINGQCEGILDNSVAGAVNCILPDPTDPNKIIIGTTNGGIWKIDNAVQFGASWRLVSDNLPSMSISSIVNVDYDENIFYAGVATTSSFGRLGGPLVGILKSSDQGETWNVLSNNFRGFQVLDVEHAFYNPGFNPSLQNGVYSDFGNGLGTTYAATDRGLFISYDENTFTAAPQIPQSRVSDIINVGKGYEFYVAIPGDSVYFSNDFGQSFTSLNVNVKSAINVKLALTNNFLVIAQADTADLNTFAVVDVVNRMDRVTVLAGNPGPSTSEDFGSTTVGPFTSPQKLTHFSLTTYDREDGTVEIFIGGVVNKHLLFGSTGQSGYSGRIFIGLLNNNNIEWKPIVGNGASGTAPHADSRFMAIDANNDLLQGCDGGIYKFNRNIPETSNLRKWITLNHNLKNLEVTRVAWDAQNNVIIAGLQDNGSAEQMISAFADEEKIWTDARLSTFFGFNFSTAVGDGYAVNVDNQHQPPIRYIMQNHFTSLSMREYNEINPAFVFPWNRYGFHYNCFGDNCALNSADNNPNAIKDDIGVFPFELNAIDQSKFVIGARAIYGFTNRGGEMEVIDSSQTQSLTSAIAYGHPDNEDMLYFAKISDTLIARRSSSNGNILRKQIFSTPTSVLDMAIDIDNPDNLFLATNSNQVLKVENFASTDMTITNLNFQPFESTNPPTLLNTINSFKLTINEVENSILLVGCLGGVYVKNDQFGNTNWLKLADNFPNVIITDVKYYPEDDILLIGTLGRGVWTIANFSNHIPALER